MTFTTILLLILIGLAAGFLSGLIGIGGGVLIVPALVMLLGITQKQAQGTSLGILLLPVGILAVMQYYKQGYLDIRLVIIVSLGFVIGGFLGSKLAVSLSDARMKKIFAIVMMLIAIKMLFFDKPAATGEANPGPSTKIQQSDRSNP
jgi:uncharacterized membrane protein YfcA